MYMGGTGDLTMLGAERDMRRRNRAYDGYMVLQIIKQKTEVQLNTGFGSELTWKCNGAARNADVRVICDQNPPWRLLGLVESGSCQAQSRKPCLSERNGWSNRGNAERMVIFQASKGRAEKNNSGRMTKWFIASMPYWISRSLCC